MRNVVAPVVGLALFAAAGWVIWKVVLPGFGGSGPPPPPAAEAALEGLPADFVQRVEQADDAAAAELLRTGRDRYTLPLQRSELSALRTRRRADASARLAARIDELLLESRCADAVRAVEAFERSWGDDATTKQWTGRIREEQARKVDERIAEVDALVEAGRYTAAREACRAPEGYFEDDQARRIDEHREVVERRIRVRSYQPDRHPPVVDGGKPPEAVRAIPSPPPALPGAPHPDVKRLGEARALLERMHALFRGGQYGPIDKAAQDFLGYFADLPYVKRRMDGILALRSLARYKTGGFKGLFQATEVKQRGRELELVYRFADPAELFDWEAIKPIPHAGDGRFEKARDGVRGTGVAGLALHAFFENDVKLSCVASLQEPKSHGIAFLEAGNEQRQVVLLATNHWFTEGENYVKKRPGHSILLIGKGVNNDVPVDSPEVGFVFKGASESKPSPPPGADITLTLSVENSQARGTVRYRRDEATLVREAKGDDGRGFQRHRPTLFVIEAGVVFRDVRVRGKVHPDFEKERERELIDLAGSAFE